MLPYLRYALCAPEHVEHDKLRELAAGARIAATIGPDLIPMIHETKSWNEDAKSVSLTTYFVDTIEEVEASLGIPWTTLLRRAERLSLSKIELTRSRLGLAGQMAIPDLDKSFVLHVDGSRNDMGEAGWGFTFRGPGEETVAEGFGPVITMPGEEFDGAVEPSNIAGEATAVIRGLDFVLLHIDKFRLQGLNEVLVINVDQRLGVQAAEGLWRIQSEPALLLELIRQDEKARTAGLKIVLNWKRSHQDTAADSVAGRGNDRADELANLGARRPTSFRGTGKLNFLVIPEAPRGPVAVQMQGVERPPQDYNANPEPALESKSPGDLADAHKTWLETKNWRSNRRTIKDSRFQNFLVMLLTGAHWQEGHPLRMAHDKIGRLDDTLNLEDWRFHGRRLLRWKVQPRLLWARVYAIANMGVTDRKMSAGPRAQQKAMHNKAIKQHKKLQQVCQERSLRGKIPQGKRSPASKPLPWIRLRVRKKGKPVIKLGEQIRGWNIPEPEPPVPIQVAPCRYGCQQGEDSIRHYLGIGKDVHAKNVPPHPCPAWLRWVEDQHPDRDKDSPKITGHWFLGHVGSKEERINGLEALHALRSTGMPAQDEAQAEQVIPFALQPHSRRKRAGRIALEMTRDPTGTKRDLSKHAKDYEQALNLAKQGFRDRLREATDVAKRALLPVALNFYGPVKQIGTWRSHIQQWTPPDSSIRINALPEEELDLPPVPSDVADKTREEWWTERIPVTGMVGDVKPVIQDLLDVLRHNHALQEAQELEQTLSDAALWAGEDAIIVPEKEDGSCRWPDCLHRLGDSHREKYEHDRRCACRPLWHVPEEPKKKVRRTGKTGKTPTSTHTKSFISIDAGGETCRTFPMVREAMLQRRHGALEIAASGYERLHGMKKIVPEADYDLLELSKAHGLDLKVEDFADEQDIPRIRIWGSATSLIAVLGYLRTLCRLACGEWTPPAFLPPQIYEKQGS